jgi:hypothetical protein
MYPVATALITAVVHPLRCYALIQSHEALFFTAIVGPISLVALAIYYATPLRNEKLRDRRAFWPFLISGFFETLAVYSCSWHSRRGRSWSSRRSTPRP